MAALWSSIRKDLRWRWSDPASLVMWVGIPLLIGGLMALAFGGGVRPEARLLLADRDDSVLSRILSGASGGDAPLRIEKVSAAEGRRRIAEGDGSGFLVLPKGFGAAVLEEQPVHLELLVNPSQSILPKILQEVLQIGVDGSFYLQRIAGDLLRQMRRQLPDGQKLPSQVRFLAVGAQMYRKLEAVEPALFPPVLSVERELTPSQEAAQAEESAGTSFSIGLFLFPGILFMSLMFIAQGVTYDLWREKDQGTLARLLCSPTGAGTFMISKMISGTAVMVLVAAAGLLLGYLTFDLPLAVLPVALLWIGFAGTSLLALFSVMQMLAGSSRAANVLTSVFVFPLMMAGGSFIPFGSMPPAMAAVGRYTPNGLAVGQLDAIVRGEVDAAALWTAALQIGVLTLVLGAVATRMLRTRFAVK